METPIYNIQKKEQVNYLAQDYNFQSCHITAENNLKIKLDLLKLSSVSPLIKSILDSYDLPLFILGTVNIIIPDSSLEELKTLHHLMSSNDGDSLCLTMENWSKLQSLLDVLDCKTDNCERNSNKDKDPDHLISMDNETVAESSIDDNENSICDDMEEFESNFALRQDISGKFDSGRESSPVRLKVPGLVSILKSNKKPNLRENVIESSVKQENQSLSMLRVNLLSQTIPRPVPRSFVLNKKLESEDATEAPAKIMIPSVSAASRPTVLHKSNKNEKCASHQGLALPKIKRNETLSIVKGSNAEPQTTSKSHFPDCQTVAPEVRKVSAKIKPLPLCKKSGQLPSRTKTEIRSGHRSPSESLSDESETISNLMKFFSPKIKRTAPKKIEKSGVKSVKKPPTCGNCTNCEINKQIRR